jgi:hypothetical protein
VEHFRKFRLLKGAVIGLLLFQLGLMVAMASSAPLHETLHCDAEHSEHHCEVTLFQNGTLGDGLGSPDASAAFIRWENPDVTVTSREADAIASHLVGGVLAQGPARAP